MCNQRKRVIISLAWCIQNTSFPVAVSMNDKKALQVHNLCSQAPQTKQIITGFASRFFNKYLSRYALVGLPARLRVCSSYLHSPCNKHILFARNCVVCVSFGKDSYSVFFNSVQWSHAFVRFCSLRLRVRSKLGTSSGLLGLCEYVYLLVSLFIVCGASLPTAAFSSFRTSTTTTAKSPQLSVNHPAFVRENFEETTRYIHRFHCVICIEIPINNTD